jgi:transcriptional regulator with XRE-family HTH domain
MAYIDTGMISAEDFRTRREAVRHKQQSLAEALNCSPATIRNFEKGRTRRIYSVKWGDLARELGIPPEKTRLVMAKPPESLPSN